MQSTKHANRTERNEETLKYAKNHKDRYIGQDVDRLRQMAGMMRSDDIAIELGRSLRGVTWKAQTLGIPMPDVRTGLVTYRGGQYPLETLDDACAHRAAILEETPGVDVSVMKAGSGYIAVTREKGWKPK